MSNNKKKFEIRECLFTRKDENNKKENIKLEEKVEDSMLNVCELKSSQGGLK